MSTSIRRILPLALAGALYLVATPKESTAQEEPSYCTQCIFSPYTYQLICYGGASIGDDNCYCFTFTCALV
jgi:hypothetical protein